MSKYSTGELAKECGVTVRTVQYYDKRGILVPSELTDGGRRIYSEDDLKKLKIIYFLRDIGLSIDTIADILAEPNSNHVLITLLGQQTVELEDEIKEVNEKLSKTRQLIKEIQTWGWFSLDKINDIAVTMKGQKELVKVRRNIIIPGIFIDIVEIGTFLLGIIKHTWLPFVVAMVGVIIAVIFLTRYYYSKVAYICPECHEVFKPSMKEFFWAAHTPKTRKLTCSKCGHKGYSVEVYDEG